MIKMVVHVFFILFLSIFLYGHISFWTAETVEELNESNVIFQKLTSNKNQQFKVLKVFDGDTIQVEGLGLIFKIRLVGIDSPEIGFNGHKSQPFSHKAKRYLFSLLKSRKVTIRSYGTGGYDRQLAEVFVDNKNINMEMVKAGLAEVYKGKRPKNFDSQGYIKEELKASRAGKGMWIQGSIYKSPRQWRKEHPRK